MSEIQAIPGITGVLLGQKPDAAGQLIRLLARTQTDTGELRDAQQLAQLDGLLQHARAHVPFWSARLARLGHGELGWESFRTIPILTRAELQDSGSELQVKNPPPALRITGKATTSGSTGTPVTTHSTWGLGVLARALQLRFQRWHDFDFDAPCAFITSPTPPGVADPPEGGTGPTWAAPLGTGKSHNLNLLAATDEQLAWLCRLAPTYLATYPSNLQTLLLRSRELGQRPQGLRAVVLSSEPVSDELRGLCREIWGAPALATYSASEVGAIGFDAADGSGLVVQSENVLVEVLRDDGSACVAGEVGRVVITTLQDLLRPLLRYEIGDYAEVGEAPSGNVRLPRLRRVLGRERTMIRLPDGRRVWPHFEFGELVRLEALRQWQLVQKRDGTLEVKVVPISNWSDEADRAVLQVVQDALPGLAVSLRVVDKIARTPRGKYLELISELD